MPKAEMLSKLLAKAAFQFSKAKMYTPELDAKLLLQHVTGFTSAQLISKSNDVLETTKTSEFWSYAERRLNNEPVHRILGHRDFYGRTFHLSKDTLIPRPDTEILVEQVIKHGPAKVLELGTGSGAIAVSLACEMLEVEITATDISSNAIETAKSNAKAHNVGDRIKFVEADLYEGLKGKFDVIVSNPPYIVTKEIKLLQKEVQLFDPARALDGGRDGLDFYRAIFKGYSKLLKAKGGIFLEIGIGQEEQVTELAKKSGFSHVTVIKDLNQINRVVVAKL